MKRPTLEQAAKVALEEFGPCPTQSDADRAVVMLARAVLEAAKLMRKPATGASPRAELWRAMRLAARRTK